MVCDRETVKTPASQVGFFSFMILPFFKGLAKTFPKMQVCCDNNEANIGYWKEEQGKQEKEE